MSTPNVTQDAPAPAKLTPYAGADWMAKAVQYLRRGKDRKRTPLGRELNDFEKKVADILGATFQGIYHIEDAVLSGRWEGWIVELTLQSRELATFDFDHLTSLVVLCHDAHVRLSISPLNFTRIRLMFHPRERDGCVSTRHPTIEAAVERTRRHRGDLRPEAERVA